jgi:hypothetical protein
MATKSQPTEEPVEEITSNYRTYVLPEQGVSVQARTYDEALAKAKKLEEKK